MGTFLAATTGAGGGCYWHLVGSGQGFCSTPCSAQGIPTIESVLGQDTNSAEVEKPSFRITYKVMPRMFHFPAIFKHSPLYNVLKPGGKDSLLSVFMSRAPAHLNTLSE